MRILSRELKGSELTKSQEVGLRNFFLQRAQLAQNVAQASGALQGLKELKDIPFLRVENDQRTASVSDSKRQNVKLELVDLLGNPFSGAKDSKVSLIDSAKTVKDVSTNAKVTRDNTLITLNLADEKLGNYEAQVTTKGYTQSTRVTVADKLTLTSAQYAVLPTARFPTKFDGQVNYPQKIGTIKQAQDESFIHLSVVAGFAKTAAQKPLQVYLTL